MLKRWAVMLVVMLLVLGSMGAVLAEEGDTEAAKEPPPPGSETFELLNELLDPFETILTLVVFWGQEAPADPPECPDGDTGSGGIFFLSAPVAEVVDECALNVEGPNEQVNHGSMVSAFVHWLKSESAQELLEAAEVPKGHLVRQLAKEDFGKGNYEPPDDPGDLDPELELEEAEEDDGNGPPEWVLEKKAEKVKGKKK